MTDPALAAERIIDAAEALGSGRQIESHEKRLQRRHPFEGLVALLLQHPDGRREGPMVLRGGDLSIGGLAVVSRDALPTGVKGVLQLVRPNGQFALVGVEVRHCHYQGNLEHRTGLQFVPLPEGFTRQEFLDEEGRMMLLDPLLRQNCRPDSDEAT